MTMKNTLTLRNLYLFLCIALLLLVGYKGFHIYQKMETMAQAELLYAQKKLVQAEDRYQKARNNRSLLYKEELLASRLQELAPITSMKQSLSSLDQRLTRVGDAGDFSGFMNVYAELLEAEEKLAGQWEAHASYYDEIAAYYGIPDDVKRIFLQFIGLFTRQANELLEGQQYDDNSFKWNLIRIPDSFYGGGKQKDEKLLSLFQRYDEAVMTRLAGAGQYNELLNWSHAMSSEYADRSLPAAWVNDKTDELVLTMLQKDVQRERPADFVSHAKGYRDYLDRSGLHNATIMEYVQNQINRWIIAADAMVQGQSYEEAIALYEALSGYQDMSNQLQAAKLAWTIHDPIRLFNMAGITTNFSYVSGGGKRFGGVACAIGVDEGNIVYLAVMNADESVQLFQNHDFPSEIEVRQISIEESLSTERNPVLLVEGDAGTDLVLHSAYEARDSNLMPLFHFTAAGYQVQPDKSLLVTNLEGASPDEIAIFERQGDQYGFTGYQVNYTDIDIANIENYSNEKVRFSVNILEGGYGEALAERDGHYVLLKGDLDFPAGSATIIGTFSEYQQMEIPGSSPPPAVPDPVEQETGQVDGGTMVETDTPSAPVATEEINPEDTQQDNSESRDGAGTAKLTKVPVVEVETME